MKSSIIGWVCGAVVACLMGAAIVGCEEKQPPPQPRQATPGGSGATGNLGAPAPVTPPSTAQASPRPAPPEEARIGGNVDFSGVEGAVQATTRNFIVVLDNSGSMENALSRDDIQALRDQGVTNVRNRIEGARWALERFFRSVPEGDNIGLWVFKDSNDGLRQLVPLGTGNRDALLGALRTVQAKTGTPLGDAIYEGAEIALAQYKKQLGYGEYRLLVVTDGEQSAGPGARSLAQGVEHAKKLGVPIYTIGFTVGGDHALKRDSYFYRSASGAKALDEALQEVFVEAGDDYKIVDPQVPPKKGP